jgi:HNH endonuclease
MSRILRENARFCLTGSGRALEAECAELENTLSGRPGSTACDDPEGWRQKSSLVPVALAQSPRKEEVRHVTCSVTGLPSLCPDRRGRASWQRDRRPLRTGRCSVRQALGSAETSERLSCDASRTWIRHDEEGVPVEVGRKTRTIPPALRRALLHRDQVCRFPGCERRFVQAHHIRHWAHGGPTVLSNLMLLCRYHHRAVHEEGYQVTRGENGALAFHRPDGQAVLEAP